MIFRVRGLVLCALALLLSSCRYGSQALPDDLVQGEDYPRALAREYRALADIQAGKADWSDASRFTEKAERASDGIHVDPEHPEDWDIRPERLEMLRGARRELLDAVTGEMIRGAPELSAKVYVFYDCWVEQEENWWIREEDECRTGFFDLINRLSMVAQIPAEEEQLAQAKSAETIKKEKKEPPAALSPLPGKAVKESLPSPSAKSAGLKDSAMVRPNEESSEKGADEVAAATKSQPAAVPPQAVTAGEAQDVVGPQPAPAVERPDLDGPAAVDPGKPVIYFAAESAAIPPDGLELIKTLAAEWKKKPRTDDIISVYGHADRSGSEADSLRLSVRYAMAVQDALAKEGVDTSAMEVYGFGESDPAAATEDGVKNPKNRRVEIVFP